MSVFKEKHKRRAEKNTYLGNVRTLRQVTDMKEKASLEGTVVAI